MESTQIIINSQSGEISFNFEEMKQFLNSRLEEFRGAIFTDDSIKSAKKYTAELRKEQTAFRNRIGDVKKEYMVPFEEFKLKADELVRLYDEPITFIDGQVKDFEERRKKEKRKTINGIYAEVAADISDYIPLEKIYNSKWENTTFKRNDIVKEITEISQSARQAVETISAMNSESCEKALSMYRQDLSLANAIAYINNYERQKAEILLKEQERRRLEEAERIRREERERIEAEQRAERNRIEAEQRAEREKQEAVEAAKEEAANEVIEGLTPELEGEANLYEYRISLTDDARIKLEMYLDSVGFEWERM